jgi:co-chaperonin GroES (HSP10)
MASEKNTYEEVGIVIDLPNFLKVKNEEEPKEFLSKGDKVYFDSWLAAKYPNPNNKKEFYWLVRFEDIRAIEKNEDQISK